MSFFKDFNLSKLALSFYILSITLLPLGFGGNRDMPFGAAQIGLAVSAFLLAIEPSILKNCFWPKRILASLVMFALVLIWGFIQTQSFTPDAWHHPLWNDAAKMLNTKLPSSIALWHDEAFFSLNRLITYIIAGILAFVFAQDPARARLMVQALWYSGIAICIYGYFNIATGSDTVLWIQKRQYQGDFTATFVNRNHYAIYAAMVLLSGIALMYQSWRGALREIGKQSYFKQLGGWIMHTAFWELLIALFVFGSIIITHSRAGLMLSLVGITAFFFFYNLYAKQWVKALQIVGLSLLAGAGIVMYAVTMSNHFAQLFVDQSSQDRLAVYTLCLQSIADNPWLGYGMGSFEAVFKLYNTTVRDAFDLAHSDILESLVDLGIPAGLLLWCAIAILLSGLMRGIFKRRRNGVYPALGIAACITALCHSSVDFSLQIPGVVMPMAMLLGTGLAQSWSNSDKNQSSQN